MREKLSLENFLNIIKFLNFHVKRFVGDSVFDEEKVVFLYINWK